MGVEKEQSSLVRVEVDETQLPISALSAVVEKRTCVVHSKLPSHGALDNDIHTQSRHTHRSEHDNETADNMGHNHNMNIHNIADTQTCIRLARNHMRFHTLGLARRALQPRTLPYYTAGLSESPDRGLATATPKDEWEQDAVQYNALPSPEMHRPLASVKLQHSPSVRWFGRYIPLS